MSPAIQLDEEELPKVARILSKINRTNIRYTFYITKNIGKDIPRCTFIARMEHLYYTTAVLLSMNYAILQLNLFKQPILC